MSIICNICLSALDLKEDSIRSTSCGHVFHEICLNQALRTSGNCPQCRSYNIQNTQLFLTFEEEESDQAVGGEAKGNDKLSKQMSQLSKKLDKLSATVATTQANGPPNPGFGCDREVIMYRDLVHQLQRENQDLKEILEMERILSTNTEREMEDLKVEVRERNDLINGLQNQNDVLQAENRLYETRRVDTENLLDL